MISYLIIDDEPIAHGIIEKYCGELSHLKKVGNCYQATEALEKLHNSKVDVIFLDINMPGLTGFEFLKTLSKSPIVIVTSAYQEYALEGYELDVCDYLLKPFSFERFVKAINKATAQIQSLQRANTQTVHADIKENSVIFIQEKGGKKQHRVSEDQILFIEASGNYSKIVLSDEEITTHQKISKFEDILSDRFFLRVHRSFIVAKNKISTLEGNMIEIADHKIPIGQTYKDKVKELLSF